MQCMILFPGRDGRLPSADEMRRAGFVLSAAMGRGQTCGAGAGVALAAEEHAVFAGTHASLHDPPGPKPLAEPEPEAATG